MADEGTANHEQHEQRPSVRIRPVSRGDLPEGRRVVPVEVDGGLVWAVDGDAKIGDICDEFNQLLDYMVGCGLWQQNWGSAETIPPQSRPH